MWNERTLYNYVDYGIFTAKNIDMPRVIRMSKRKKKKNFKVDKNVVLGEHIMILNHLQKTILISLL